MLTFLVVDICAVLRFACVGTSTSQALPLNLTLLLADTEKQRCLALEPYARNGYGVVLSLLFLKILSYGTFYESIGVYIIILGEVARRDVSVCPASSICSSYLLPTVAKVAKACQHSTGVRSADLDHLHRRRSHVFIDARTIQFVD